MAQADHYWDAFIVKCFNLGYATRKINSYKDWVLKSKASNLIRDSVWNGLYLTKADKLGDIDSIDFLKLDRYKKRCVAHAFWEFYHKDNRY